MKQQFILVLVLFAAIVFVQSISLPAVSDDKISIPTHCPLVKCIGPCPNGFIINELGCLTCECNPCRFGQPLYKFPCGKGQDICKKNKGLCKVSLGDNTYCCPNERPGCCPPSFNPALILCARPNCKNDFDCSIGQKCCKPCSRCVNATLY